ncbi:regulator of sigma E protease [Marinospirillum celere]|uniref:Zinc metalloprotease n=1 Tax=Marinospirillum celere TaxID=1122252 RepID=A0A1I1IQ12_9GAMM|nr:sigma E protease regulator RseP [Marinospirillum celere]SFC38314.1 regulator of sigma E protease [Marinospirillum celere]
MDFLHSLLALIVTLGVLITFHEYGHFWVARRCGVKVLRFSVGFGKPLVRWYDKQGTEYVIAALPLGGYVKMLDEREAEVPEELLEQSFNRKPVGQRFAIVAAGPLANFLLAIVAYWFLFVIGTSVPAPVVGQVTDGSPAAEAGLQSGDEVLKVGNRTTPSWQEVGLGLLNHMGETTSIALEVQNTRDTSSRQLELQVERFLSGQDQPDPLSSLGIQPWRPDVEPILANIQNSSPAQEAGLQPGDRVVAVNQENIENWQQLVDQLQANPGRELELTLDRQGERLRVMVTPATRQLDDGREVGFIGAGVQMPEWPEDLLREQRFGPVASLWRATEKTGEMSWLTLNAIGKMVTGLISPTNLSGPITIARVASDSAKSGWESFITFLAYVSISLAILNLLPIPILDGGHLVYYAIEAIRGKPVSERVQEMAARFGLLILGSLMLMAFYFDLLRL